MSIHDAAAIVSRLGPCRIALDAKAHGRLAQELALLGCAVHPVSAEPNGSLTGYLEWPQAGASQPLADALRPFAAADRLVVRSAGQSRDWIERTVLAAGWRRHPGAMPHDEYAQWSVHALPALTFYTRAGTGSAVGSSDSLLARGGADIDAVIARYAKAASHVRPGDLVLADGAFAADGARIVEALSPAGTVLFDQPLGRLANHSVDLIVALQPAMSEGWQARLDEYVRILKFDGRLVLVIRRAEKPGDALPAGWNDLYAELSNRFLVEARYEQMAITTDPLGPRDMLPALLDRDGGGPWLFAVASANPLAGAGQGAPFRHPAFADEAHVPILADFGGAYDNPWLYRTMVQMGERLGNEETLGRLAEYVIGNAALGSADQGAALTVYGYRALETRAVGAVTGLLDAIGGYFVAAGDTPAPHVARWKISLAFLAGRLSELAGDRDAALNWYRTTAEADWEAFSPILATKAVGAAFYEARLHIAAGDHAEARSALRQGVDTALRAAACPHADHMGDPERPLPFYLTELAEVIDMGSQCANALARFHLLERDPGLFWRGVDVKRFGLATWNGDLERENRQLRTEIVQRRA